MKILKLLLKYLCLLIIGGSIYYDIEILYRGYSHISMFLLGGICFVLIGLINEIMPWDVYIEIQTLIGAACVTVLEFITGCIVNLWLGLHVWDYSNLPFNILGQICLPFALIWIPLVFIAIILDDYIRYLYFHEEHPRYKSLILKNKIFKHK